MAKTRDLSNIQTYSVADGSTRWRVQMRVAGRRINEAGFESEAAAIEFRDRLRVSQHDDTPPASKSSRLSLDQYMAKHYWPDYAKREISERTRKDYRATWIKWVRLYPIAKKAITAIDAEDVLEWKTAVEEDGAGDATILRAMTIMSGVFTFAAQRPRSSGVTGNPLRVVKWPSQKRSRRVWIFPPSVIERVRRELLSYTEGGRGEWAAERDAMMIAIMSTTGIRPGELLRLQLRDVRTRTIALEETKTDRPRSVPLFEPIAADIEEFAGRYALLDDSFLIAQRDGQPFDPDDWKRWTTRTFHRARARAGARMAAEREAFGTRYNPALEQTRPYELCRHSFAGLMLASGMTLERLADIMGHSVKVLSDTYTHVIEEYRDRTDPIDPLEEILAARAEVYPDLPDEAQAA